MTYDRIRITPKLNVHAFSTFEKFAGGVVVIPPGAVGDDARRYLRGEVGDAVVAFMDGELEFPVINGVLDIYRGWTERRVAQDTMAGWDEPQQEPDVESAEAKIPRLDIKKIQKRLERGV